MNIFNRCLTDRETIPEEWRVGIIRSVHKKEATTKCETYRGITVTSSIGSLYGQVIRNRTEHNIMLRKDLITLSPFNN